MLKGNDKMQDHSLSGGGRFLQGYLSFEFIHFLPLLRVQRIDDPLFSLPPHLVQVVKQQLQLRLGEITFTLLHKLLCKGVDILRDPEPTFWDKLFVAGAEMQSGFLLVVESGLRFLIGCVEETDSVVVQSQVGKLLVLLGCLQHFQQPPGIVAEVLVFYLPVVEDLLVASQNIIVGKQLSFPSLQLADAIVSLDNLSLELPDAIFVSGVGDPQEGQFIIFLIHHFLERTDVSLKGGIICEIVAAHEFFMVQRILIVRRGFSDHFNHSLMVGLGVASHILVGNDSLLLGWLGLLGGLGLDLLFRFGGAGRRECRGRRSLVLLGLVH